MKITIKTKNGDMEVTAYGIKAVPGLVVNRLAGADDRWGITHKPSGYLVSGEQFKTREEALRTAKRLAGLTDWTAAADQLGDMRELGQAVRDALYGPVSLSTPGDGCCTGSIVEELLPDGWELEGDDLDGLLICPHGHKIEMDGACHEGCVSPLRTAGLI